MTEPVGGMFSSMFPLGTGTGNCGNPTFAGLQSPFTFNGPCNVSNLSRILTQAINGPKVKTDGVDILADLDFDDVWNGAARIGGSVTYIRKYTVEATTVEGVVVSPAFDGVNHLNYQTQIFPIPQVDLTYRVFLPWDTTAVLGVNNIFDNDPSFARLDLGYDPFTGNPIGRTYKLSVTKKF